MDHLQSFRSRPVEALPVFQSSGWTLKRYAIFADGRSFDDAVALAASSEALRRLPKAGNLSDSDGNHGIGFQIIHFAQIAVVSPVFYWRWGSVLANIDQLRASWDAPTKFGDGVSDVVGCIWEMEIGQFEIEAWKATFLSPTGTPEERLSDYIKKQAPTNALNAE